MTEPALKRTLAKAWPGAGLWNVYFILKFVAASIGYLNLNLFANALLLAGIVVPLENRFLKVLRQIVAITAGVALAYSESWLPSVESIMANAGNIADFSLIYIAQVAWDAINWPMLGAVALAVILYLFVKDWVRVTAVTVCYLTWLFVQPYYVAWTTPKVETKVLVEEKATDAASPMGPHQSGTSDSASINAWLKAFYEHEAKRVTKFPASVAEGAPFDILLINICSLAWDDLEQAKLANHPVFNRFDIYLEGFNSATAYSGPATIRLLRASCGQTSHTALYDGRRPECELMNNLGELGYRQHVFMDHEGKFDDYVVSLKNRAGLEPTLASQANYRLRYTGFDGEPIFDDADVFKDWLTMTQTSQDARNVTLFNLIALHDGNRALGTSRGMAFAPRAQVLLDQLQNLMGAIEASGRRVMVVVVPEHGAAVRGDKIQMARLRDIPSPHITKVPVMVKYFGLNADVAPVHVKTPTSYLAVSEMIARTLDIDLYNQKDPTAVVTNIARDLPQTYPVSENANAAVVRFQDKYFVRLNDGEWLPYMQ